MRTIKYIFSAFMAAGVLAGCTSEVEYLPGAEDNPDNYGVYFPTQTTPTEVEVSTTDPTEVTYRIRRTKYLDEITVPFELTASEEGIFDIEPIVFKAGEQETEIKVNFENAEKGKTYDCEIRIVDPDYISLYKPRTTSLSFSVVRADWELLDSEYGHTGKWRDDIVGNLYSVNSSAFNPNPEIEVEIYQREDKPGYYRMKVYGESFMSALMSGNATSFESKDLWTVIDAQDPDKVFIPYQSTGLTLVSDDGEMRIASNVPENFSMDASVGQYGTMKDGIITFPPQSIVIELSSSAGNFYYANLSGLQRLTLPGITVPDYSVSLSKTEPADGVVTVRATFADDAKYFKYSIFEGVLTDAQVDLKALEMDQTQVFDGTLIGTSNIRITDMQTGKYTLIGCIYDESEVMRDYASISFGYVALGEERNVNLKVGLEATNEYENEGISTDNAARFYVYGENIESASYALFRTDRISGLDAGALLDAQGTSFTEDEISQINTTHYSNMITGLNGDSDYTLFVRAFNGYVTQIFSTTYKTTGTFNPALETYTYNDFLDNSNQPTVEDLTDPKGWNYYAIDFANMDYDPVRRRIGSVYFSLNEEMSSSAGQILDIKGLSGVEFEEGGLMMGIYMPNSPDFSSYKGAFGLISTQDMTGVYNGEEMNMGFVAEEDGQIYFGGGTMFFGAVADGYLYCVPSPVFSSEQNLTFNYLYTGSINVLVSLMSEMMLVDPDKDLGGLPGAAAARIAGIRKLAAETFMGSPRNYVELPAYAGVPDKVSGTFAAPLNLAVLMKPASAPAVRKAEASLSVADAYGSVGQDCTFIRNRVPSAGQR